MKLIAFDPGKTTGWASWSPQERYKSGEVNMRVWLYLGVYTLNTTQLIVERDERMHDVSDFSPYYVIGAIQEWAAQNNVPIEYQRPDQAKFYFTNERLKERQLYVPGKPHANDAMRHLLYYMEFKARLGVIDRKASPTRSEPQRPNGGENETHHRT